MCVCMLLIKREFLCCIFVRVVVVLSSTEVIILVLSVALYSVTYVMENYAMT